MTRYQTLQRESDGHFKKPEKSVSSVERAFAILAAFRPTDNSLSNIEISDRTNLPKSTISRMTSTLVDLGYLWFDELNRDYRLGPNVMSLAKVYMAANSINKRVLPYLGDICERTGASAALSERHGLEMVYSECVRPDQLVTVTLDVGSRLPISTTAVGRAYIAALPNSRQERILDAIRARHREDWLVIRTGIEAGIRDFNDLGYCRAYGDFNEQINAIATPFTNPIDGSLRAINASGIAWKMSPEHMEQEIAPHMMTNVRAIEAELDTGNAAMR